MATKMIKGLRWGLASTALSGSLMALLGAGAAYALDEGALPQGGTVVGGAATIAQSGRTLTVNQSSDRTVIDWRSFDIGKGAQANFNQPGAGSIAVNRVNASANPTEIQGGLHANGQVWILNPNGVMFGKTARVDVAGIVASTANLDAARFMAGDNRLSFTGSGRGAVVNEGSISVAANGLAAFVAPSVRNSGSITARVGKVALAAGDTFTLDLAGDRLVELGLGSGAAVVDQSGRIVNEGGTVTLSAAAAGQVVDSVINMSGVTSTASARQVGGRIVLEGDAVTVAGTLDASGTSGGSIIANGKTLSVASGATLKADAGASGDGGKITLVALHNGDYAGAYSARGGSVSGAGGKIETSGLSVSVDDAIKVDASAAHGAAGQWLIDPLDVTIASGSGGGLGGSTVTVGAIQTALAGGTGVHITTDQTGSDAGDLTLASSINATSTGNAGLTLDGRHLSATGGSTINIAGGALTLNVNTVNTLADVSAQPTNWIQDANNMVGAVSGGTRINLGTATYANSATIDRSNLFLDGSAGARINVDPGNAQVFGLAIQGGTSGVTINGFKIVGEITGSYVDYVFGGGSSRGIAVVNTANGFHITNNDIRNVRTGLLVDGRGVSGASITGNLIDNTKTAVFLQYTAGAGIDISGNRQGQYGNEWGGNFHVNGDYDDSPSTLAQPGGNASPTVQAALLASKAANNGWSVQDQAYATSNRTNVLVATTGSDSNQGSAKAPLASIQKAIPAVVSGGEIDVANGTYVSTQSTGYININKPLALIGQSQAGVIIDARTGQQYGLRVTAPSNVTLKNLTVWGVVASPGYGVKIETITGLNVSNVTSQGAFKSEFDLNSVTNGVLDHLTANGAPVGGGTNTGGNGISISDSQNVTLTNSSTVNNGWGGLALYQTNAGAGAGLLQEKDITVGVGNSFSESVPIYAEDTSTLNDFGALSILGFPYIVRSPTNPADVVTVFQPTQQAAIDYASSVAPSTAWIQGYGSGITGNNIFTVGVGSVAAGSHAMSIKAALTAAQTGATVNVKNGTYVIPGGGGSYLLITKSLSLIGESQAGVIIDARNADTYAVRVAGTSASPISNVTLSNLTFYGVPIGTGYGVKIEGVNGLTLSNITSQGAAKSEFDLNGVVGGTLDHLTANGAPVAGGANTGGNGISISDSSGLALTNSTTLNNGWGGLALYQTNRSNGFAYQVKDITVDGTNTFNELNPVYLEDQSSTNDYGALNIAGFNYVVKSPNDPTDVYTWFQKTQQGAIDLAAAQSLSAATVQSYSGSGVTGDNSYIVGVSTGGQALSIQTAQNNVSAGGAINVGSGTYAQNVVVTTATNFNFGAVNLTGFTLQNTAAGSGLQGSLAAGSIALNGAVKLTGNLSLDTSASNGAITTAAIDAATPGGATLTVDAGTGTVSLGSLGSTSRLGAVQVASDTTLTSGTYNADSLAFDGNLILTAASTTLNTTKTGRAGNITVAGSVLGTTADAQSLILKTGTGSAGGNGDISLQNVGAKTLRLGSLTVSGGNFGAQTVDLAGDFGATLAGNQVFSSHTLNARSVSSSVGGNASGPINATSNIQFVVAGILSGSISGTNVTLAADKLTGATVTASRNAAVSANTMVGTSVNAAQSASVNAGSVASSTVVAAQTVNVVADTISNSDFNASQDVSLAANTVSGSSLTAPNVTAQADSFDGSVSASSGATITGGNISGDFSGGSFDIAGTGSVNATVKVVKLSVSAPQGSVSGAWQTVTGGGGVTANNAPVGPPVTPTNPVIPVTPVVPVTPVTPVTPVVPVTPTPPTNPVRLPNPNQIVAPNIPLPAVATVAPAPGPIVLPQSMVLALISPGGPTGTPKLIQVQNVQELGSLLGDGYTAIVIDLSGRTKDKKAETLVSAR